MLTNLFKKKKGNANVAIKRINNVISNDNEIPAERLELVKKDLIKILSEHFNFNEKDLKIKGKYSGQDQTKISLFIGLNNSTANYNLQEVSNIKTSKVKKIQNNINWENIKNKKS